MAIESLFFNTNQKTVIRVAEARGVIISRAAFHKIKIYEFNPLQIKQAITGYGKCEKQQLISTLPHIIKIKKTITYDDEYDAIAVGLTCTAVLRTVLLQ
jgi:crossover junction endodeoxyribonuclease RuvC